MEELTVWFFRIVSIATYIALLWLFWQIVLILKNNYQSMLTSGKLGLSQIASLFAGFVIFFGMIAIIPYLVLTVTLDSLDRYMATGLERTNKIVHDLQGMLEGNPPIYVQSETTSTIITGVDVNNSNQEGITGPGGIQPGEPIYLPDVLGGDPNDPNDPWAGGGVGIQPTPIMPEMRPTVPIPTPTPFDFNSWSPNQPAPTPSP